MEWRAKLGHILDLVENHKDAANKNIFAASEYWNNRKYDEAATLYFKADQQNQKINEHELAGKVFDPAGVSYALAKKYLQAGESY